jgi:hypothetical protein
MKKRLIIDKGQTFGQLTVIGESKTTIVNGQYRRNILCKCECGTEKIIGLRHLTSGLTNSCGCLGKDNGKVTRYKIVHNDSIFKRTETNYLYNCWNAIKQRCYNTNHKSFYNYGGRGILMFDEWVDSYIKFKEWILLNIGSRPDGFSIDRIDNNKGYFPGNLRWADWETQNNNQQKHYGVRG